MEEDRRPGAEELGVVGYVVISSTIGEAIVVRVLIDVVVLRSAVHDLAPSILRVHGEAVGEGVADFGEEGVGVRADVVGVVAEGIYRRIQVGVVDPVEVILPGVMTREASLVTGTENPALGKGVLGTERNLVRHRRRKILLNGLETDGCATCRKAVRPKVDLGGRVGGISIDVGRASGCSIKN